MLWITNFNKDNICVKEQNNMCVKVLEDLVAPYDATVISKLNKKMQLLLENKS